MICAPVFEPEVCILLCEHMRGIVQILNSRTRTFSSVKLSRNLVRILFSCAAIAIRAPVTLVRRRDWITCDK